MRLLWMALRNLARNRRRTALSLGIVAAGTVGILLTAGFIAFSFAGLSEALIHGGLGHFEVVAEAAIEDRSATLERSMEHGLEDWRSLQERIETLPGAGDEILAASPTVQLMGMASTPEGASGSFVGLGVDPERERRMGFETRMRRGEDLSDAPPAFGDDKALVALGLAETLGVEPGDVVTLMALTPDGMLNALDVTVAGIVTTGVQDLDTRFLKIHRASAARLLETERVTNLIVTLEDTERTDAVGELLRDRLAEHRPSLAVVDWEERAPFYGQVQNLYLGIFWFLGSIIFVLVILSAMNTLVMAVMERVREIGTLRAVGTGRLTVAALILLEALWLGLLGGLLGNVLGLGLILLINASNLKMPPPPGAVSPIDLEVALVPEAFVFAVVLMTFVLAVAAVVPAWKAVRLSIVDALRHV